MLALCCCHLYLNRFDLSKYCFSAAQQINKNKHKCVLQSRTKRSYYYDYSIFIEIMNSKNVITALASLAQESRLAVFRLLVQAGPEGMPAMKIAEALSIPPSSMSFHLKELTHANMVTQTKAGRSLIYAANFETMNSLLAFLTENCCGGNLCSPVGVPACTSDTALKT